MNRRDFLHNAPTPFEPEPSRLFDSSLTLLRVTRRLMATQFEIAIPYGTPQALPAAQAALDRIADIESWMTVYDESSEVSRVNRDAARAPVSLSESLFNLLSQSSALSRETNGAFDPAVGAMIKAWGFYCREGRLPTARERARAMACSGMKHVALSEANRTVKFLRPGLELNFGGIGKGFALDRAAELLINDWGITSALLHGGGSSVRAIGAPPNDPRGWRIALNHPYDPNQSLGEIRLKNRGLGTSAATFQFFVYKGRKYGHVLDPRSGHPAEGTASASILALTSSEADALSTAAFVMGATAFDAFRKPRPDIDAVILPEDGDRSPDDATNNDASNRSANDSAVLPTIP
ncbi:MAG: FAD:protein FMN transferase [Gemmataceae bacterium]